MTTNQIAYWDNIERARHNEETEAQARRSEIANDLRQKEKLIYDDAKLSKQIAADLTEAMMKSPGLVSKFINAFPALGANIGALTDVANANKQFQEIDERQSGLYVDVSGRNSSSSPLPITYGRRTA